MLRGLTCGLITEGTPTDSSYRRSLAVKPADASSLTSAFVNDVHTHNGLFHKFVPKILAEQYKSNPSSISYHCLLITTPPRECSEKNYQGIQCVKDRLL